MRVSTYADVLTSAHPMAQALANGTKQQPGALLQDLLNKSGGRYEVTIDLPAQFREKLRKLAELTSDSKLANLADQTEVTISLEHLRTHDPGSTRIVYGYRLDREPGDPALPGFDK
ncbi:hypothetical protein [Phytohabitans rumicis]|uniref:Uncharacterized protein n=1 Tax=Phytohabitans rumicis TaxID=1076125 RepID=A0A6V8KVC7_9ACTN|nr:hypothetical protein [Phytohabitans rumicis]GFJ86361.1 hypothetical protein Prum_000030 [Phytohabitans rumicis]